MDEIDAMLGDLSRAQENHRDIVVVAGAKLGVFVDINLGEARAEFREQGRDLLFGFFAKMASRTRVNRDVAWSRKLESPVFGARVGIRLAGRAQPTSLDKMRHDAASGSRFSQIREG